MRLVLLPEDEQSTLAVQLLYIYIYMMLFCFAFQVAWSTRTSNLSESGILFIIHFVRDC